MNTFTGTTEKPEERQRLELHEACQKQNVCHLAGVAGWKVTLREDEHIFLRQAATQGLENTVTDCVVLSKGKKIQLGVDKEGSREQSFQQWAGLGEIDENKISEFKVAGIQ